MPAIDFFRRKSQNLSTVIESIYGLRTNDQADKALAVASQNFSELAGYTLSEILEMKADVYLQEILKQHFSLSYLEQLVKFLLETSEIFTQLQKNAEMLNLSEKALYLIRHLIETDKTYSPERESFVALLEEKIKNK
ncbi:MAG: hypothetical protein RB289_06080 [Paludibacter sp.]|jgi:Fe-S cluster assembly ATPase SufC|nr:hypothetical protein [Paludibacter sp.]MDX9919538.1 hypothetical protein [Paludibacter sp.]